MSRAAIVTALVLLAANPATAASSPWLESEGGAVRIVTSGLADNAGELRGALEIRLEPGWKTYWRDPGEAGVPPQIDLSPSQEISGVEILFPAPERIQDEYAIWSGYRESVALPLVFTGATPGSAGIVEGSVFLGICETICIPFQADFSFDAGADPDNASDAMVVEAAFAALPAEARPGFRVEDVRQERDRLLLRATLPEGAAEPALFLTAPEGVQLGTPAIERREGGTVAFSAAIIGAPEEEAKLDYTLVAGDEAVSGRIAWR